ncbi:hypothetical protein BG005_004133 [Podila minutissima]|nr:hypothetical protein BG005_004133 [Podila minutissima]
MKRLLIRLLMRRMPYNNNNNNNNNNSSSSNNNNNRQAAQRASLRRIIRQRDPQMRALRGVKNLRLNQQSHPYQPEDSVP